MKQTGQPHATISLDLVQDLLVVDEWLDSDTCQRLMNDGDLLCPTTKGRVFHGGRHFVPNTSDNWNRLCRESDAWRSLERRLGSREFLSWIMSELGSGSGSSDLVPVQLYSAPRSAIARFFRGPEVVELPRRSQPLKWAKSSLYHALLGLRRRIRFHLTRILHRRNAVELLCDYSRASNGYGRVIHRDSDMRRYVFLLYLNTLDDADGGDLDVYRLADPSNGSPAWPDDNQCVLERSVRPAEGRLVVFRNAHDSFHGVSTMQGHDSIRHFIYGGFTQLGGTNPDMIGSTEAISTEFHLYA